MATALKSEPEEMARETPGLIDVAAGALQPAAAGADQRGGNGMKAALPNQKRVVERENWTGFALYS